MEAESESGELAQPAQVLVDAHVHLYPCFELARCFAAAWRNFAAHAGVRPFTGMLLLTETWQDDAFGELARRADAGQPIESASGVRFSVRRTGEPDSLALAGTADETLFVLAGRQVQTAEGLEVLVIGSLDAPADGTPLADAVAHARSVGALPVIPWGFGKWWGRRGRLLTSFLAADRGELFLGDNGGRPSGTPEPLHFQSARSRGLHVLPGSDPLPLASQAVRAGSYGFACPGRIDRERPSAALKAAVRAKGFGPRPFGAGETPVRFARHQVLMQLRKHRLLPKVAEGRA